jgi:hypothetical protein
MGTMKMKDWLRIEAVEKWKEYLERTDGTSISKQADLQSNLYGKRDLERQRKI